ncbi:MAG: response regulator [Candidatus Omnitrophota bacterium]|jgi:DNA-binding response OmpR family regulator|nr:response regulator [Candidatus Omnitrophota bacterium]
MFKILVIDDEIDICEMMKDFFGNRGYEVIYALTGRGGLDAFIIERPHVVILDLCLKDMFGLEVLKKIKSSRPSCVVIIITGSALEEDKKEAIRLGADYYISKPCSMSKLNELIAKL